MMTMRSWKNNQPVKENNGVRNKKSRLKRARSNITEKKKCYIDKTTPLKTIQDMTRIIQED